MSSPPPGGRHPRSAAPHGRAEAGQSAPTARARFRALDAYRVDREWKRYEGTPLRRLFRELRERALAGWIPPGKDVLEVGPGPGRFSPGLRARARALTLVDLSRTMLERTRKRLVARPQGGGIARYVRGDATRPPFVVDSFDAVVALGNIVGFAAGDAERTIGAMADVVRPGGSLIVEVAPATGERSRYLARLPPSAVGRLFESPPSLVQRRVESEGFDAAGPDPSHGDRFRRLSTEATRQILESNGFEVVAARAVAPSLASDEERIAAIARSSRAWSRFLEIEERLGDDPRRWIRAAAVLIDARRRGEGPATRP